MHAATRRVRRLQRREVFATLGGLQTPLAALSKQQNVLAIFDVKNGERFWQVR